MRAIHPLENIRNIHMKTEIPKLFGHILMAQAKPKIIANMSKYQIGARPGHRAQEHIFTLKSVIALYVSLRCALIIQFFDVSKFFDRENLQDGMDALYNYGIKGKLYRLMYNLSMQF